MICFPPVSFLWDSFEPVTHKLLKWMTYHLMKIYLPSICGMNRVINKTNSELPYEVQMVKYRYFNIVIRVK